jgi:hypothetical protein
LSTKVCFVYLPYLIQEALMDSGLRPAKTISKSFMDATIDIKTRSHFDIAKEKMKASP